jgi:hypothetical protein
MTNDTPLWQLTVGELNAMLSLTFREAAASIKSEPTVKYLNGLDEILPALKLSYKKWTEYRVAGWIEPAISQHGKKIVCEYYHAMELIKTNKQNK